MNEFRLKYQILSIKIMNRIHEITFDFYAVHHLNVNSGSILKTSFISTEWI